MTGSERDGQTPAAGARIDPISSGVSRVRGPQGDARLRVIADQGIEMFSGIHAVSIPQINVFDGDARRQLLFQHVVPILVATMDLAHFGDVQFWIELAKPGIDAEFFEPGFAGIVVFGQDELPPENRTVT